MNTADEDARDEWYANLVDEISGDAIAAFAFDRLRSYYIKNPRLAIAAFSTHHEAEKIQDISPSSALVFFTAAIELGVKLALLEPVVYGLVHNESVASLISGLVVRNNGFDRVGSLLTAVLKTYGQIDFDKFKIKGHEKLLREEILILQKARNSVVHQGVLVEYEVAELGRVVSQTILCVYLAAVLNGLDLKLNGQGVVEEINFLPQFDQWRNRETNFRAIFRLLTIDIELEAAPGILIIFDETSTHGSVLAVDNLRHELPLHLASHSPPVKCYWKLVRDSTEKLTLLGALGPAPVRVAEDEATVFGKSGR